MNKLILTILFDSPSPPLVITIVMIPAAIILFFLFRWVAKSQKLELEKAEEQQREFLCNLGVIEQVRVGNYILGLPNVNYCPYPIVCYITKTEFLFFDHRQNILDRIPLAAVQNIQVEDKSQLSQRLSAAGLIAFGALALAAPKTDMNRIFCLLFEWTDTHGLAQRTIFEFSGFEAIRQANVANNTLRKYLSPGRIR